MKKILQFLGMLAIASEMLCAQTPYETDVDTVVLYHFDEAGSQSTLPDSSGHQRDAVYGKSVTLGLDSLPKLGNSIKTGGDLNGRITYRDASATDGRESPIYKFPQGDFTIEAWVKPSEEFAKFEEGNRPIVIIQPEGVATVDFTFSILASNGKHYLAIGDYGGPNRVWTHTAPLDWEVGETEAFIVRIFSQLKRMSPL